MLDNRPQAIIVTFPVKFLIDLGKSVAAKLRDESFKQGIGLKIYGDEGKKLTIRTGFKECIEQIEFCNSDPEDYWSHIMGNVPVEAVRDNISHCYINILSKIRYRSKVICFECSKKSESITKKFGDGRRMSGKNWILLHQFEKLNPEIKMGGFQGFRYWKEDYH